MLGGWAAESDRYIRVSKSCIARIQQLVSSSFADGSSQAPLCEEEALQDFAVFLKTHVSEEECSRCLNILGQRTFVSVPREHELPVEEQALQIIQFPSEQLQQEDEDFEERAVAKEEARRKQQAWNVERTEKLGQNRERPDDSSENLWIKASTWQSAPRTSPDVAPFGCVLHDPQHGLQRFHIPGHTDAQQTSLRPSLQVVRQIRASRAERRRIKRMWDKHVVVVGRRERASGVRHRLLERSSVDPSLGRVHGVTPASGESRHEHQHLLESSLETPVPGESPSRRSSQKRNDCAARAKRLRDS